MLEKNLEIFLILEKFKFLNFTKINNDVIGLVWRGGLTQEGGGWGGEGVMRREVDDWLREDLRRKRRKRFRFRDDEDDPVRGALQRRHGLFVRHVLQILLRHQLLEFKLGVNLVSSDIFKNG